MLKNKIKQEVKKRIESTINNDFLDERNREELARNLATEYEEKSDYAFDDLLEFILEIIFAIF